MGSVEHQYYTAVTFPWGGVYLQMVMVYDAVSAQTEQKMHCRLLFSHDLHQWNEIDPGGEDFIPLGGHGTFDSHIIFAASGVQRIEGQERVYYLGGNGPHYGARNSSLGLALFRPYGLVGIGPVNTQGVDSSLHTQGVGSPLYTQEVDSLSGSSTAWTRVLTASGSKLLVTADIAAGDSLTISRQCINGGCTSSSADGIEGNVTDIQVVFNTPFQVGDDVILSLSFASADPRSRVYVFKWTNGTGGR